MADKTLLINVVINNRNGAAAAQAAKASAAAQVAAVQQGVAGQVRATVSGQAMLDRIQSQWAAKDYRGRVRAEARKAAAADAAGKRAALQADRDAAALDRIETTWRAREYRDRTRFERRKTELAQAEERRRRELVLRGAADQSRGMALIERAIGSLAGKFMALAGAGAIVGAITEAFESAKKSAEEAVKFVEGYTEALRELSALKGQSGKTERTLGEDIAFRRQTLQTSAESEAYQKAALGQGQAAIMAKKISEAEFKKLMVAGGKFQAMQGASPETMGALTGMLPTLVGGKDVTAEAAKQKLGHLYKIFEPGGPDFEPQVKMFMENQSLVSSGTISAERLAALQSGLSLTAQDQSAARVQQLTRATVGGLGKLRGTQMMEGIGSEEDNQKQGEYLEGLGASVDMDPIQIAKLMVKDIDRAAADAAKRGAAFGALPYMKSRGFTNEQDVRALLDFKGLVDSGAWDKTFEPLSAQGGIPKAGEMDDQLKMFAAGPQGRARRATITEDAKKAAEGFGPMGMYETMMREAWAKLELPGTYEEVKDASPTDLVATKRKFAASDEIVRTVEEERKKAGLAPYKFEGSMDEGYYGTSAQGFAESLQESIQEIMAAGGQMPQIDTEGLMRSLEENTAATTRLTEQIVAGQARKGVPPPNAPMKPNNAKGGGRP